MGRGEGKPRACHSERPEQPGRGSRHGLDHSEMAPWPPSRASGGPVAIIWLVLALCLLALPALAETRLCNRTSMVVEAALAVQAQSTAATRGWFRLDPGQCRALLQTAESPGRLFLHTRALPFYPERDLGLTGTARFCVGESDFLIPGAERCARPGGTMVGFAEVRPTIVDGIGVLFLSEEADFDLPQARLAGVQRLLALMGYDVGPADGLDGPRTAAAIRAFLTDRALPLDAPGAPDFIEQLVTAARAGEGPGFVWCNETSETVMAALGLPAGQSITTRGWFRVTPGQCLRPTIESAPDHVFSFAEAVDAQGRRLARGGRALVFGGAAALCVRASEFDFPDQADCAARGGANVGFLRVTFDGRRRAVVRFRE